MTQKASGTLESIKKFNTARGAMYSITVGGDFYGTGSKVPPAKEGDIVEFEFSINGKYRNIDMDTFKVTGTGSVKPSGGGKSGNSYDDRQDVISRQAALNSALAYLTLASTLEALPIPKANKDRLPALDLLLAKKAAEFYTQNTGVPFKPLGAAADEEGPAEEEIDSDDDNWT